jgi:uncharacterized membrane protein YcaP (DUF421 family)
VDAVLRAAIVYLALLVIFRITGKRSIAQMTSFDFVLLLIVSEPPSRLCWARTSRSRWPYS